MACSSRAWLRFVLAETGATVVGRRCVACPDLAEVTLAFADGTAGAGVATDGLPPNRSPKKLPTLSASPPAASWAP